MNYVRSTAEVVSGILLAAADLVLTGEPVFVVAVVLAGLLVVAGLVLATHGLFSGIEAAIAAGTERSDVDRSTEP